jgi:hypothetical protein
MEHPPIDPPIAAAAQAEAAVAHVRTLETMLEHMRRAPARERQPQPRVIPVRLTGMESLGPPVRR